MPGFPIRSLRSLANVLGLILCLFLAGQMAMAQTFQCTVNAGIPPIVRVEDLAALTGDLVLICNGGTPTPNGVAIPAVNVQVYFNTNLTSRILYPTGSWAEPLLLIDEPMPANQVACTDSAGYCTRLGGSTGPNVFMGQASAVNGVAFLGIPLDPPGGSATRVLRMTNFRVNANQLGSVLPAQVVAYVAVTGATSVPISNPQQTVAFVQQGLNFSRRSADNSAAIPPAPAILSAVTRQRVATLRFSEMFATSFKTRTAAAFVNTETSPSPVAQNTPGVLYGSETGFYSPALPSGNNNTARNMNFAGLADSGTRLGAVFTNIPAGVTLYVSTVPVTFSGGVPSPAPGTVGQARLIDPNIQAFTPLAFTDTIDGIPARALQLDGGTATAFWEVLKSDSLSVENLHFSVWVSSSGIASGTASVAGGLVPLSVISSASATAPLPRFADTSTSAALFSVQAQTPTAVGVGPAAGSGAASTMTFTFSNPNGWQNLGVVNVLVNNNLDGRYACYLAYSKPNNLLYLMNDAGTALLPSLTVNGTGSLSNSQCTLTNPIVNGSGNTMTLTMGMSFASSFGGSKVMYLAARDAVEVNSGWQRLGVWQVPGAAQTTTTAVVGMNPARGSGTGGTFTYTFTDTMGANDLGVMNILVNDWLDGRHACYLAYARGNNTLYLMNDNGDGLLPGKVLNGSGSLGNSQCTVNGVGSSATPSGNTLTLTLNMTFSAGFAGNRVFYLAARDVNELNNTGWKAMGSWTVQ